MNDIKVEVVEKSARKAIIKRSVNATEYMGDCREVGCGVWDALLSMELWAVKR